MKDTSSSDNKDAWPEPEREPASLLGFGAELTADTQTWEKKDQENVNK